MPQNTSSPEGAKEGGDGRRSWPVRPLSSILREPLRNGHSAPASSDPHGIRTLTLTAVTLGDFSERNTKITSADPHRVKDLWLEPGDILIERSNAPDLVGTTRLFRGERNFAIFPDLIIRARLNHEADPRFVELVLQSDPLRLYFKSRAKGMSGSMPKIDQGTIAEAPIPAIPLPEQRRIVAEIEKQFTRLDAGVAALRRVQANLKRYRAAVLKAACEGRLVPTEAARGPQIEGYGPPDPLPTGWRWTTAAEICDAVVDCHNQTAPYTDSGIPLVRTTNIRGGKIHLEETRFVDQPTYEFWSKRCAPKPGDVLFTREAPMGEAGIIPDGATLCMGQRMMLLRSSPQILNRYLLTALITPGLLAHITRIAVGSGVKHLRVRDVESLPIPLPPLAEQTRIVAEVERRLSVVEELESMVTANLQRATRLRHSILTKAFAGGV